ncbi:hypothetical protein [Rhodopirellula sp. MGV]|uniref:hypothetical protein n=1 Tax=Rhodopirellula sp. MGV TaxID=2023130 RepID=UPI00117A047D|nr:hypothetical protein [Rhodopirellula sp. MGV]
MSVQLQPPTLNGTENETQQIEKLSPMIGGLSMRQFTRDSQVAPVRIDLKYIKDDSGNRVGHLVHVLFVVHCPLERFAEGQLSQQLSGEVETDDSETSSFAKPVDEVTLRENGVQSIEDNQRFRHIQTTLLDKIKLDAVLRIDTHKSPQQNRIDLLLDDRFAAQWTSTEDPKQTGTYTGFQAWLTATKLAGADAVVIESRLAMHEPPEWFSGSNFIRSKLPLVLQQTARDLRRKLAD